MLEMKKAIFWKCSKLSVPSTRIRSVQCSYSIRQFKHNIDA